MSKEKKTGMRESRFSPFALRSLSTSQLGSHHQPVESDSWKERFFSDEEQLFFADK